MDMLEAGTPVVSETTERMSASLMIRGELEVTDPDELRCGGMLLRLVLVLWILLLFAVCGMR